MTEKELDELKRMHSANDLDAFKFMHQNFDDLLSLARIGLAAVDEEKVMKYATPGRTATSWVEAVKHKEGLIDAYLARKDG